MSVCVQYGLAVQQYNDHLHFATDTHVLGCCISCYKSKRGPEYCRLIGLFKQLLAVNVKKMTTVSQNVNRKCIMRAKCIPHKVTLPEPELPHCCLELQGSGGGSCMRLGGAEGLACC